MTHTPPPPRPLLVQDLADLLVSLDPGLCRPDRAEATATWPMKPSPDDGGHGGPAAVRLVLVVGAYRSDELYPALAHA